MHKSTWGRGAQCPPPPPQVLLHIFTHIHSLCILLSHLEALGSGGIRDVICAKALGVEGHSALHLHPKCFLTYSHIFTAFASHIFTAFASILRHLGKKSAKVVNIRFHHSYIFHTL